MSETTMRSFLDLPGILPQFVEVNRSRATGAGLDPYEHARVTADLDSLYGWPDAFRKAGRGHMMRGPTVSPPKGCR
ncbi:MAG: 2,6-dihydropseudooxynicotine hydrolase [Actinomycetia bacterium]|nr:2,6-dihydropseudooxynicotine hydrolase [Actinomycetes bacterium]